MRTEHKRVGNESDPLHRLVPVEPGDKPARARVLSVGALALVLGVLGAVLWQARPQIGELERLPQEQAAQVPAAPEQASTVTSTTAVSTQRAGERVAFAVPTRSPTRTSTPFPYLDSIEGVVGLGGTDLWEAASGMLNRRLGQGELLTVYERSTDEYWLHGQAEDGTDGWVSAEAMIVFDTQRLRPRDVILIPITPTPTSVLSADVDLPVSADITATPESAVAPTEITIHPTPPAPAQVSGRVTGIDTRLNIRSGPGSSYRVIAKALPGETLVLLGRDQDANWLKIGMPNVGGSFGWASTDYVESQADISLLPVVDEISSAAPYIEKVKSQDVVANHPSAGPTPRLAASVLADGLRGKLAIQATWGGDIYIYDLASGASHLLSGGFDPAISPDGNHVAFTRDGGENGIYIVDIDGSNERLIFSGRAGLRSPKWSPDGHYIVFERSDESIECRLHDNGRCLPETPRLDHLPRALEWQSKLSRVDVNGENFRDLAVLNRAHAPDWNSAGIVYHSPAGIQVTEDIPNARSREVYFNVQKQYELDPDRQRDGGRILFQQREASHWEIFSVAPDGSGLVALTRPPFAMADELPSNVSPAWSPDGRHIVFLSNRAEDYSVGEWGIWVMDADGSNQRQLPVEVPLTYTYVAEQMVDWGP